MQPTYAWILTSALLVLTVSCTSISTSDRVIDDTAVSYSPSHPSRSVTFVATDDPIVFDVRIDSKKVGVHRNLRQAEQICGYLNDLRTWLVVEDGCGGDSYPKVTAYRMTEDGLKHSEELERIDDEHYLEYRKGVGLTDPVFLGFDSTGLPVISSATGTHTLRE